MAAARVVSEQTFIAVAPLTVYDAITDLTRMGDWSPENTGAAVPSKQPYVGMTFEGSNKRGPMRWVTRCTVTAADPGTRFAFKVHAWAMGRPVVPFIPFPIATWAYDMTEAPGGTTVTETWTDIRPGPGPAWRPFDAVALGGKTFDVHNAATMRTTLRNLKAELERVPLG